MFRSGPRTATSYPGVGWPSGRGAPGGDRIALYDVEGELCVELPAGIEREDARAHVPRAEEARPRGFRPAGIGQVPVDVRGFQVEPKLAGGAVAEAVAFLGVEDHLGMSGGAAGEVDDA